MHRLRIEWVCLPQKEGCAVHQVFLRGVGAVSQLYFFVVVNIDFIVISVDFDMPVPTLYKEDHSILDRSIYCKIGGADSSTLGKANHCERSDLLRPRPQLRARSANAI